MAPGGRIGASRMSCVALHSPRPDPSGPASQQAGSRLLRAVNEAAVASDAAADPPVRSEANSDGRHGVLCEGIASWLEPISGRLAVRWPGQSRTSERIRAMGCELVEELASAVGSWNRLTPLAVAGWYLRSRAKDGSYRPATLDTARYKQGIARAVFEEAAALGVAVDPDTAAGDRIARPRPKRVRPLTDPETDRLREIADSAAPESKQLPVVALVSAGGSATDIAPVSVEDIDLDAATVTFCGAAARVGRLDEWSVQTLARHLGHDTAIEPGVPVCIRTRTTPEREVESVSRHLRRVLRAAGLYELEGVSADSIRLHAAQRVLDTDGIVAAARFLGWRSLDRTAEALDHQWRRRGD